MNDTVFCSSCGAKVAADAKFCGSCGAEQEGLAAAVAPAGNTPAAANVEPPSAPPSPTMPPATTSLTPDSQVAPEAAPPPPPTRDPGADPKSRPSVAREGRGHQFADRVGAFEPDARDFGNQLAAGVQTPGVLTALVSALIASAVCFAAGLLLAVALPDDSLIGRLGTSVGLITEAFGQTVQLLLVKFEVEGLRVGPLLLVAIPVAACAAATMNQAHRTRGSSSRTRLIWGAAVGVPFGFLMLVAAVSTGDLDAPIGGALMLGVLWGALGGLAGMALAIRRDAPETLGAVVPPQAQMTFRRVAAALKPLGVLLAITALIGTGAWWFGSLRDHASARVDRSLPVALVENTVYAGEHAVNFAALGGGVQFTTSENALSPIPFNEPGDFKSEFRLFDVDDSMKAYFFVPLLLLLIALPILLALYAGFAVARAGGHREPVTAAAWGAIVGPAWAISLALLNALHAKVLGEPNSDSLFGIFLLGGVVLGAAGGLLASRTDGPVSEGKPGG